MALGATTAMGAETRPMYSPIWGIPLAVLEDQDRHPGAVGNGIGAESLLGEGRADDPHHLVPVDQVLEGVDRPRLVTAGILKYQFDGGAVDPALGVEELFGDPGTVHLFFAEQGHVAGLGHTDADGNGGRDLFGRTPLRQGQGSETTSVKRFMLLLLSVMPFFHSRIRSRRMMYCFSFRICS